MLLRSGRVYLQRADPASWQVRREVPCQIPSGGCRRVQLAHPRDRGDSHMAGATARGNAGTVAVTAAAPRPGLDRLLLGSLKAGRKQVFSSSGLHSSGNADLAQGHSRNLYVKQLAPS